MDSSWKGLGASPYPESVCSERVMRIKICHFVSFSTEECYWLFSRKVSGIHCISTADVLLRHGVLPGIPSAGASPQVPPTRHWHIHHSTLPPCSEPFDNFPLHLELRKKVKPWPLASAWVTWSSPSPVPPVGLCARCSLSARL